MQEEMKFLHKPELQYEKLSGVSDYFVKLAAFNSRFGMDLDYTAKARWKPGTYDKIKNKMRDIEYPHWLNKRGANNFRKLFDTNTWNRRKFVDEITILDNMMQKYRWRGQCLIDGDLVEQGKAVMKEIYTTLSRQVTNVSVKILPFPLFNRSWYEENSNSNVHVPYCPQLNPISLDIDTSIDGENMNKRVFDKKEDIWKDNSPSNWFINVIVKLPNVNLKVYDKVGKHTDENLLISHLYGDVVVGITISLFDYVLGRRAVLNNTSLGHSTNKITMYSYKFPKIKGIQHPFIHRMREDSSITQQCRIYGYGNQCFGDWNNDIVKQFLYGNLGIMRALLRSWSEIFYVSNTGPLNALPLSFVGNSKSWSEELRGKIAIDPNNCQRVIDKGMEKETLLDNHCADCTLAAELSCKLYRKLTKKFRELPSEFAEWALEKAIDITEHVQPQIELAKGLKLMFVKLYNMDYAETQNPETTIQNAFFVNCHSSIKGHMTDKFIDDTFRNVFKDMINDGYQFNKVILNKLFIIAERIFYIKRIREIWHEFGVMDNIYKQYCFEYSAYGTLEDVEMKYPVKEMKSSLNMMMYQAGISNVNNDGAFVNTLDNDFISYITYIGGLDEW